MLLLLKNRNFFTYWLSHFVSVVGDHVTLLAFPWLTLALTGSAAMTGLVLAAQGLPRAIFMLWGGSLVDRYNPRRVILYTHIARLLVMIVLTALLINETVTMTWVFVVAGLFGIADAFYYPASNSIIPRIAKDDDLQAANGLIQVTTNLSIIIGPSIAGFLIAGELNTQMLHGDDPTLSFEGDRSGLIRAYIFDTATFAVSLLALLFVRLFPRDGEDEDENGAALPSTLLNGMKEAIKFVWSIPALRLAFIGIALLEVFYQAPIFVGLPVLAKERFSEGALIYGFEIAAYGFGAFLGALIGGLMTPLKGARLVPVMFWLFGWSGAALGLVVLWEPYEWAMLVFFTAGFGDNLIWVHMITWVQRVTPPKLLGRVMGIFMFMAVGLLPVGNLIFGLLFEIHLEASLMAASIIMVILCAVAALHPHSKITTPLETRG